ncbi:MAG: response regulator transcription factor [Marinirhabdus sp.]
MFYKVLVVEDLDSINQGVVHILKEKMGIPNVQKALYCDDAFLRILKSKNENKPFDLMVADLSFTKDHRSQKIATGQQLIDKARKAIPTIKILVYSIENRPAKIKPLFEQYAINGYICKGRKGLKELQQAVLKMHQGINYVSRELERTLKSSTIFELENFDILLLQRLSKGFLQEQVSLQFKKEGISPNSISTIEKHLNQLKLQFKAKNTTHLIAIVKDLGLI